MSTRPATYGVETARFGVLYYETDEGIEGARRWARKAHGIRSRRAVWRCVTYRYCEACDCKPCLCEATR